MKRLAYWTIVGCVLAALVHIAVVLGARNFDSTSFAQRVNAFPVNAAHVFTPEGLEVEAAELLLFDPSVRYGVCRFDLRKGGVDVVVPNRTLYWSATAHTLSGEQFHAISNRNRRDDTIRFAVLGADVYDGLISGFGRRQLRRRSVRSPSQEGFILFRFGIERPSAHADVESVLADVRCRELEQENPREVRKEAATLP